MRFSKSYEYEYLFESAAESLACNDYGEDESKHIDDLIRSYYCGEIGSIPDEIYDHKPVNVKKTLEKYRPADPTESRLIDCFRKGLPFISSESIMTYDYDRYGNGVFGNEDDLPVTLDRIVRYVYDPDDFVYGEIEYFTNQSYQYSYAVEPTSFAVLRPDSKLFVPDDYPERFSD